MGAFQKTQIGQRVHGPDRPRAVIRRTPNIKAQPLGSGQQVHGAFGHFLGRAHFATGEVGLRMMKRLVRVKERLHGKGTPLSLTPFTTKSRATPMW